jgi:membrane protein
MSSFETLEERKYWIFNKQIHRLGERFQHVILPGFDGVPLYDAIWFFIKGLQKGSLNTRASSVAFNFMLALGPGVIFLLTLIPYLPISNFQQEILGVFNRIMPENSYIAIESLLNEIFQKRGGLPIFGLLLSLFFAHKGIVGILEAFSASYHAIDTRGFYNQRLIAAALVIIFYLLVITAALILFFSKSFVEKLVELDYIKTNTTYFMLLIGKWLIIIGITYFFISFLYYLAPQHKMKWRFFSAGSIIATILTLIASLGFSYFVNHFAPLNQFY